jgi:hypothetical protein
VKRFLLLCLSTIPVTSVLFGQLPSLKSYTVSGISSLAFAYTGTEKGSDNAEIPPWILPGTAGDGRRSYFFVNGINTYLWSSKASLTDNKAFNLDLSDGPHLASMPYVGSSGYAAGNLILNWKRNYHGIYSAVGFSHPSQGPVSLGFLHGENKNVISDDGTRYQNTVQQNELIDPADSNSWSGGNPYHEGWDAYNGIISAAWIPNTAQTNGGLQFFNNELGPIAWPATGYVTKTGMKCTAGLRHPACIVAGNYVYVFYLDAGRYSGNIPDEEGRHEGIKLLRAPLNAALDPQAYEVFYRDSSGRDTWNPSLPPGFTRDRMLDFAAVKGPKATDLMNDTDNVSQEIRFSAAKVRDSDYYIGVEQYIDLSDSAKFKVALRFSFDLVHWSDRSLVVYAAGNWNNSRMNYPIFLSNDGASNTEIDLKDFYILGTGNTPGAYVNRMHIQQTPSLTTAASMALALTSSRGVTENLFPNPAQGPCQFQYSLNTPSEVEISLFDIQGRHLQTLEKATQLPGNYTRYFDVGKLSDGVYIIGLRVNNSLRVYRVVKQ